MVTRVRTARARTSATVQGGFSRRAVGPEASVTWSCCSAGADGSGIGLWGADTEFGIQKTAFNLHDTLGCRVALKLPGQLSAARLQDEGEKPLVMPCGACRCR